MNSVRVAGILLLLLFVTACSGGGSPTSTTQLPGQASGEFTLSSSSLSFSAKRLKSVPSTQQINVHLSDTSGARMTAGYRTGTTPFGWLIFSINNSGPDYTFTVTIFTTNLDAGTYSTTMVISTIDSNGALLQTRDVQITYVVTEGVRITSAPPDAISGIAGSSILSTSRQVTVATAASLGWTATSDAAWLTVPSELQHGPGVVTLNIDYANLRAGSYTGTVTFVNADDPSDTVAVPISMKLTEPVLAASAESLTLGGTSGLDTETGSVTFTLGTGSRSHPQTVFVSTTSGGNWLRATPSSDVISGAGTSVTIDIDRTILAKGTYNGRVRLHATVNGQVLGIDVPIVLNIDSNKLLVSANGIALSSFPSRKMLTRTLAVKDTLGLTGVAWTASANQSWLAVTPSGRTGDQLTITANQNGLVPGQYFATVTISSPSPTIENAETVRVGLTIDSNDPTSVTLNLADPGSMSMVANPVEPEFYRIDNVSIKVYNVYSGNLLRTFTPTTAGLNVVAISSDGQTLYVADSGDNIIAIDPVTGSIRSTLRTLRGVTRGNSLVYARPDAHPVLLAPGLSVDVANDSLRLLSSSIGSGIWMLATPDQRLMYSYDKSSASVREIRYSTFDTQGLLIKFLSTQGSLKTVAMAFSADGSKLYTAPATSPPYQVNILNAQQHTMFGSLPTGPYRAMNIGVCWNGVVAGTIESWSAVVEPIWVYDSTGTLLTKFDTSQDAPPARQMTLSSDCTRFIVQTSSKLLLLPLPAP